MLKYTKDEYLIMVQMSHKPHLLVEGVSDSLALVELVVQLTGTTPASVNWKINIDTPEKIIETNGQYGNREIVEFIAKQAIHVNNLVCLVDREFREFQLNPLLDKLNGHYVKNRLCWTLGHSIENYFFLPEILSSVFTTISKNQKKYEAKNLFLKIYDSSLLVIASLSIAAKELKCKNLPIGIVFWEHFYIKDNEILIDANMWKKHAIKNGKVNKKISDFISEYHKWVKIFSSSPPTLLQKICRGHTGMQIFLKIFAACIFDCEKPNLTSDQLDKCKKDLTAFCSVNEDIYFNLMAKSWGELAKNGNAPYPNDVLGLLGY